MKYLSTFNKLVAVKPPLVKEQVAKKIGGLNIIDEKLSLIELEVVLDSVDGWEVGDSVYVHGDNAYKQAWWKAFYKIGDVEFILVPIDFIWVGGQEAP